MSTYYKATRPDGTDFWTGKIRYEVGSVVRHPNPHGDHPSGYLSVATVPTECMRMCWPCRLFAVEPFDCEPRIVDEYANKRAVTALRVIEERPAHEALGPQGEHVAPLIKRCATLSADEILKLDAAWDAAGDAARDTATALVVRDLIGQHGFTQAHYDTVTRPWRTAFGRLHPDDADLAA